MKLQTVLVAFLLAGSIGLEPQHVSKSLPQALHGLSTAQKIGQMLQARIYFNSSGVQKAEDPAVLDAIKLQHIGSLDVRVHLSGPNVLRVKASAVAGRLNEMQAASTIPLLVGADIERGLITRISDAPDMPNTMAWSAANDPPLLQPIGESVASEARAVGIHWAFAPVVDVNGDPDNPIIGDRSFGDDPAQVGAMAASFIQSARSKGLLTTAKHFPGEGDTDTDTHIGLVTLKQDIPHLRRVEFPPFQRSIDAGVDAVMLGHVRVPALDPDRNKVATTSKRIIEGTLRHDLGFRGVVVTDSMEMRGLTDLYKSYPNPAGRAAVDAVKAGADILMVPDHIDEVFQSLLVAVKSGEIPESRIDEAVGRILAMKERVGLLRNRYVDLSKVDEVVSRKSDWELAQRVADESVTLVREKTFSLPLQKTTTGSPVSGKSPEKVALVVFSDSNRSPLGKAFEETFRARLPDVQVRHVYYDNRATWETSDLIDVVHGADRIVIAAFITNLPGKKDIAHGRLVDVVGLNGHSAEVMSQILGIAGPKALVVSLGSPYMILHYPEIQNYVCTFSVSSTSERAAVKALFGEIDNKAKLPVNLPGVAERGFSIKWPRSGAKASLQ